jgi:hypothetical protein
VDPCDPQPLDAPPRHAQDAQLQPIDDDAVADHRQAAQAVHQQAAHGIELLGVDLVVEQLLEDVGRDPAVDEGFVL